jgi:hypothetical protein
LRYADVTQSGRCLDESADHFETIFKSAAGFAFGLWRKAKLAELGAFHFSS